MSRESVQSCTRAGLVSSAREPFALRMMKANCLSAEELALGEFIDIETARQLHCTNRPDFGAPMAKAYRRTKSG